MIIATSTATSLADLKASAPNKISVVYAGSLWTWTAGNFSGQADDVNIVKADSTALSAGAWVRGGRLPELSVLDVIPADRHSAIRAGTITEDLTAYLQLACRQSHRVLLPAGKYPITKVGIRETILVGDGEANTTLVALPGGTDADFMLDAMLDTDGTTANTVGAGYAQGMTLDAGTSTRSGLRTYGGGAYVRNMRFVGLQVGASFGLPIWMKAHNLLAQGCKIVGFRTFSAAGDTATSLTMDNCWALNCYRGFHITQLAYSTFSACVAQDCTENNWFVEGDANGVAACYSLTFLSPATEGTGTPFVFRKVRDMVVISPRVISPDGNSHLMTLDDAAGSVVNFSTPGTPPGGRSHLNVINHGSGNGSIAVINCAVSTVNVSQRIFLTSMGSIINGSPRTTSGAVLEFDGGSVAEGRYFDGANVDGYAGIRGMAGDGTRLIALRRIGGVALSSKGAFSSPTSSLQSGDIVPYVTETELKFQVKTPTGVLKSATLQLSAP